MLDGVPVGAVREQLEIDVPDVFLESPMLEVRSCCCGHPLTVWAVQIGVERLHVPLALN